MAPPLEHNISTIRHLPSYVRSITSPVIRWRRSDKKKLRVTKSKTNMVKNETTTPTSDVASIHLRVQIQPQLPVNFFTFLHRRPLGSRRGKHHEFTTQLTERSVAWHERSPAPSSETCPRTPYVCGRGLGDDAAARAHRTNRGFNRAPAEKPRGFVTWDRARYFFRRRARAARPVPASKSLNRSCAVHLGVSDTTQLLLFPPIMLPFRLSEHCNSHRLIS